MATAYETPLDEAAGISRALNPALASSWLSEPFGLNLPLSCAMVEPTKVEVELYPVIVVDVERCEVCIVADVGAIGVSSPRDGSTAGDNILPSGQPGCGLSPVDDKEGVDAEKS